MNGNDFFTFYEKYKNTTQSECRKSSACKFPDCGMKMVWIPPPKKGDLRGVIISRDPTTGFIELYKNASKKSDEECRRELMGDKGVPVNTIIDRIEKVYQSKGTRKNLSNFLLNNCYWTHLLKCCTYSSRKSDIESISFHKACLDGCKDCCSKQWLSRELDLICEQPDIEAIILLGADVTKTVYRLLSIKNKETWHKSQPYRGCKLIPLPHPSRANGASWAPPMNPIFLDNIKEINRIYETSGKNES
jgi:hypothetical protein